MNSIITRKTKPQIISTLKRNKIAIIYGARQVGKTTLSRDIAASYNSKYFTCDDPETISKLINKSAVQLKSAIGNADLIIIDEAQKLKNIGNILKLIHDTYPVMKIIATGSCSFELSNIINEPLTGRAVEHELYPLSSSEIYDTKYDAYRNLERHLVFGSYPEVISISNLEAEEFLYELATRYIFKDAFGPTTRYDYNLIYDMLKLLSHQLGAAVNYSEIGSTLSVDKQTVKRYISLLEDARIIFRLEKYSGNLRSEVGRLRKIYFYDNGIRNGLIDNFESINFRNDKGALWENYCISERIKEMSFLRSRVKHYFWRNNNRAEVDLIESEKEILRAYEFKYSVKNTKIPIELSRKYPNISFDVINYENVFEEFIQVEY